MIERTKLGLAQVYENFLSVKATRQELREHLTTQKFYEDAHDYPPGARTENNPSLRELALLVESEHRDAQAEVLDVASRTPGTYRLLGVSRVTDHSTDVLVLRYLEARFAVPLTGEINGKQAEHIFTVRRQDYQFNLATDITMGQEQFPTIRITENETVPTILVPLDQGLSVDSRLIDRQGNTHVFGTTIVSSTAQNRLLP